MDPAASLCTHFRKNFPSMSPFLYDGFILNNDDLSAYDSLSPV